MKNVLCSFLNSINVFNICSSKKKNDVGEKQENSNLILSPKKWFSIRVEKTSKKDICIFHTSMPIFANDEGVRVYNYIFPLLEQSHEYELAEVRDLAAMLYDTDICQEVTIRPFSVEFKKSATWDWSDAIQLVTDAMFKYLENKYASKFESQLYTSHDGRFEARIKLFKSIEDRVVFNLNADLHDDSSCIYKVPPVGKCKKTPKDIQRLADDLISSYSCSNIAISRTAIYLTKTSSVGLDEFCPLVITRIFEFLTERHPVSFK